ncbi:MAG: type I polyketide synthase, partial [Deltaproteobacteria bacterium]|nr:type I polyketide synthase [Deltaproteobacteria bacterium]
MNDQPQTPDYRDLMQEAMLTLDSMQTRIDELENAATAPIAVIGLGCRFPGSSHSPAAFWRLLHHGQDAVSEIPTDRWDMNAYYDPDPDAPGKMNTRFGATVADIQSFDAQFFGISPREAVSLDPQQRLILEVTWEALEHAAIAPDSLAGSRTGVFVGIWGDDYAQRLAGRHPNDIDAYMALGVAHSVACGRLSYLLGLKGPSLAVDTACSSSLVAFHLAVQSLRLGESDLALAAGVNLLLSPAYSINFAKARMLSPDGRCKTFDATADGYGRGEGCGVLVLKRLTDAEADRDRILAIIRGSAVNQDGRTSGLTAPNGPAQQAVIRQALDNAGVSPAEVSYVETHGTGTPLGDPIEVGALGEVFGPDRPPQQPLMIGSVKTNIGHLEAASGLAGLIKVILSLQHQEIPPHLHLQEPTPHIPWVELPIIVPTVPTPWLMSGSPRIAGVSSFGFSGTNAHVVVSEAPFPETNQAADDRPHQILTLSAKTEQALRQLTRRYHEYLVANSDLDLADIGYTANTGRNHFSHRLAVTAATGSEAQANLAAFLAEGTAPGIIKGMASNPVKPRPVFLFTGQGAQYIGMGHKLYQTQPQFHRTIDRCDELLRPYLDQPLLSILYPAADETSPLDQTAYTQPALFALEYALAQLWQSWGLHPAAVMGHSVGEYAAACIAGGFSLEDGLKLIAARAGLM